MVGNLRKELKKYISAQEIDNRLTNFHDISPNQMTIEHYTTIKDIIHVNQLLHSLTAKDKENASTVKRIIGMMNVRNSGHSEQKTTKTWTMLHLLQKRTFDERLHFSKDLYIL